MFKNAKKTFFKTGMRKSLAILLSMAMIFTMFPMTVMADAAETVTIQITDSSGEAKTLAVWTYDSAGETYKDNATGQELSIVKDFTQAENLKGSVNGESYDFSDLGAFVYTGSNMKPDCRALAVTTKGILLEDVYDYAGTLLDASKGTDILKSDDVKMLVSASSDGKYANEYTYGDYWGKAKYYYPAWYADDDAKDSKGIVSEEDQKDARVVPTTLAIKGYHELADANIADLIAGADAKNSLRSTIGQQQGGALNTEDANLGFNSIKNITLIAFKLDKTFAEAGIGADPGDISWYNTTDKEFTISTAAQLKGLASIVNGEAGIAKDDFAGKTVKLGADIAVDADGKYTSAEGSFGAGNYVMTATYYMLDGSKDPVIWTPIGSGSATSNTNASGNAFAGTFDGQGHAVSGIYTGITEINGNTGNTDTVQGLFGIVSGTVKNVTVSGCITGKIVVGGVAAHLEGGTVENCVNNAVVYADGGQAPGSGEENGISRAGAVGGIAGYAKDGSSVKGCVNNADVTCTNTAKGGRCGGIIGLVETNDTVTIENNGNNGKINAYQYAGGIVGMNASTTSPISACYNTGNITGNTGGSCYIGGIVATCNSDILNCYNSGEYKVIYSGKAAHFGGIVSDFKETGKKIVNCYNTGMRSYTGDSNSSNGAICGTGYDTDGVIKLINCYTLEGTAGEDIDNGCVTVKKADEMKSADFVKLLNGDGSAWARGTQYPILKWQRTLESIDVSLAASAFTEGQTISKDDIKVTANYSNGIKEEVTDFDYDKKEPLTSADTELTVTYTDNGVEKTAVINITVGKAADTSWYAADKTEFVINTDNELRIFAAIVNGEMSGVAKDDFTGKTVKLGNDINVSGREWTPVGNADNAFAGTFDGQGRTISGISITSGEGGYKGLFGNNAGTLKNFTVSGNIGTAEAPIVLGFDNIGGAAGYNNGTVSAVTGKVAIRLNTTDIYAVGGIVGQNGENGTVTQCSNEADITASKAAGGIVGRNYGAVSACVNTGNISGTTNGNHGKDGIGGIVGLGGNKKGTYTNTITSCYNRGNITNDNSKWVGGIVGMIDSATTVTNCYNTGVIKGYGQYNPIIGQSEGTALYNYFLDTTKTNDEDGVYNSGGTKEGNEAKTEAEMKSADFVTLLNSKAANTWKAGNSRTNDGYAVLSWQQLNSTGGGSGSGSSGGGSSSAAPTVQKPTITAGSGGKTSLSADGTTLTITPDTGYEISKVTLNGADKGAVGTLTGLKTGDKVTVEFKAKAEAPAGSSFSDVKDSDWFSSSVKYVSENGLMTGTASGTFSPNSSTTRGMLMTILARKSGVDTAGGSPWYQKGLDWAVKNGISDGTGPNEAITREQLATMLYRYAGSPQTSGDISKFSDAGSVSAYAQNALKWAVEKGIVTGKGNNTLAPASSATRAEMAAMLQRYCELTA